MKTGSSNFISNLVAFLLGLAAWRAVIFVCGLLLQFGGPVIGAVPLIGLLVAMIGTCAGIVTGVYVVNMMLKNASSHWARILFYILVAVSGMNAAGEAGGMLDALMTFITLGIFIYHEFKLKKFFDK